MYILFLKDGNIFKFNSVNHITFCSGFLQFVSSFSCIHTVDLSKVEFFGTKKLYEELYND